METLDRKREVLNACLDLFIEKGLSRTSTRDLSSAIKLQSSGMYYYYKTKEELVVACAEEATLRIENALMAIAVKEVCNPAAMIEILIDKASELAPTMKFFVSVCSDRNYENSIKPILANMSSRFTGYCTRFASLLDCDIAQITPYVHMCIIALNNYMIFQELSFVAPQIKAVQLKLEKIVTAKYSKSGSASK